jgi:hypothetical protein
MTIVLIWGHGVGSDLVAISFRFSVFLFLYHDLHFPVITSAFSAEGCEAHGALRKRSRHHLRRSPSAAIPPTNGRGIPRQEDCLYFASFFLLLSLLLFLMSDDDTRWVASISQPAINNFRTDEPSHITSRPRSRLHRGLRNFGHGLQHVTPLNQSHYELWTHSHDVMMGRFMIWIWNSGGRGVLVILGVKKGGREMGAG